MKTSPQESMVQPRVLFVNRMASLERGGGETFDLEVSRHLDRMGCRISWLTGLPLFGAASIPLQGDRAFTVRTPYFGWFPWDVVRGGWRLRTADFWMFEQRALQWAWARRFQFDIVQVCELPTFAARWRERGGPPVVMRLTAPNFIDPRGGLLKADRVIASGTTIEKVRAGARPDCVDIPNGVDLDRFRPGPSPLRAELGLAPTAPLLLYVARFQAFKNHALLIDAMHKIVQRHPTAQLLLAGSGPLQPRVKERCRELGIDANVRFLGEVPFADLPRVYAGCDINVISSDYESFCFAAIEAMATGLPVVTTDCGWVPRLLGGADGGKPGIHNSQLTIHNSQREKTSGAARIRSVPGGIVSPVGDAEALAAACLELLEDPGRRRQMGAWNRQRAVERHGWEASAKKLLGLYEELLLKRSESSN